MCLCVCVCVCACVCVTLFHVLRGRSLSWIVALPSGTQSAPTADFGPEDARIDGWAGLRQIQSGREFHISHETGCMHSNLKRNASPKWTWNWKLSWGGCIYCLTHCVICPFPYLQYERWNVGCARHAQLWQSHQLFTRHVFLRFLNTNPFTDQHCGFSISCFCFFTPGTHHERWRKSASTWQFQLLTQRVGGMKSYLSNCHSAP